MLWGGGQAEEPRPPNAKPWPMRGSACKNATPPRPRRSRRAARLLRVTATPQARPWSREGTGGGHAHARSAPIPIRLQETTGAGVGMICRNLTTAQFRVGLMISLHVLSVASRGVARCNPSWYDLLYGQSFTGTSTGIVDNVVVDVHLDDRVIAGTGNAMVVPQCWELHLAQVRRREGAPVGGRRAAVTGAGLPCPVRWTRCRGHELPSGWSPIPNLSL